MRSEFNELSKATPNTIKNYNQRLTDGLICILWAALLLIFTSATNFDGLFHFQLPHFYWNPRPNFTEMLIVNDFNIIHKHYLIIKLGHFWGFALMDFLIYKTFRSKKKAIVITILFAISTEILQPFSFRDGRIYDMLIDSAGAWLAYSGKLRSKHT